MRNVFQPSYSKLGAALTGMLALISISANADTFSNFGNTFTIDFVDIGNPGNADDVNNPLVGGMPGDGGTPFGGVAYSYRIGKTEVPQSAFDISGINHFYNPVWTGNQPATPTWVEAAAFVNWLNTSTGHHIAYDVSFGPGNIPAYINLWSAPAAWDNDPGPGVALNRFRHKDAFYFLPSEDEWYKAAYHKNDGPTANYWDYATGSNTIPTSVISGTNPNTAVYNLSGALGQRPANVDNAGGLSPYGTRAQNGNDNEWMESAYDEINDDPGEMRAARGGAFNVLEYNLRASDRGSGSPYLTLNGFRVASVATPNIPEPSSVLLLLGSAWMGLLERRRRPGNRSS